jgi:dihydrofolate reductase
MIKLIWAVSENGWIGKDGKLPWHVSEELKHFKKLTANSTVVMGRKTWESLPIKPLPDRENIIISRTLNHIEGASVIADPFDMLEYRENFWVIGGKTIYDFFLPYADEAHVSEIFTGVTGDVEEPHLDSSWNLVKHDIYKKFAYEKYERLYK